MVEWYNLNDSTGWHSQTLVNSLSSPVQPIAASTTPTVIHDVKSGPSGTFWVFYQDASGQLYAWVGSGTTWANEPPGNSAAMAAGTSPAAVRDPTSGDISVYYHGQNQQLFDTSYTSSTGWQNWLAGNGQAMASGTSPSAVGLSNVIYVFYQGANQQLWGSWGAWGPSGSSTSTTTWANGQAGSGQPFDAGTSPSAVFQATTGRWFVFYQDASGNLYGSFPSGNTWANGPAGNANMLAGTSPSAVVDPASGDMWIYSQNPSNQLEGNCTPAGRGPTGRSETANQ